MPSSVTQAHPSTAEIPPRSHSHNPLGKVGHAALVVPLVAIAYSLRSHEKGFDIAFVSLFGALGFSIAAFMLWLRANYLAANYLEERSERRERYVARVREQSVLPSTEPHTRTLGLPRTVARLDPVLPAFLSMCAVVGAGSCIIVSILKVVWDIRATVTGDAETEARARQWHH